MDLDQCTLDALLAGYEETPEGYRCLLCGAAYASDEVFPMEGRWFTAKRAVRTHVLSEHPDLLKAYCAEAGRYVTLTDHQRGFLARIRQGNSDQDIAKSLGLSPSTVRHQRFTLREKAKQAKLYLALYTLAMQGRTGEAEAPAPTQEGETIMIAERFEMTAPEYEKILKTMFSSLEPLRLKQLSPKEKKRVACLHRIAEEFDPAKRYTEKEVNELLLPIYDDFSSLRRELVDYGFVARERDGSAYWRNG